MTDICLYFQIHQPYRVRPDYHFFDIGAKHNYQDKYHNKMVIDRVARDCYIPACEMLLHQIKQHKGAFKVSFSISGVALEQLEKHAPKVIKLFKKLLKTGCVELLGETYHHSLASVYSPTEFAEQVAMHRAKLDELFGYQPTTFRNTELIYNADIAHRVEKMGFRTILAEGCDKLLGWRSPNFVYMPDNCYKLNLLVRNHTLSDDIAFRFPRTDWEEYPLTAPKYAHWLSQEPQADIINLFMDFETFGEHQCTQRTGIMDFMAHLGEAVLEHPHLRFTTPHDISEDHQAIGKLTSTDTHSWADTERDLSAWTGNALQDSATEQVYELEPLVRATNNPKIIRAWQRLLSSDHMYYMSKKTKSDGEVHSYFSPFATPHDAYLVYINALNDLTLRCERHHDTQES